jgi:hypothetical protein
VVNTLDTLAQHQLVILRRLRAGPLTEFELAREIAEHSAYSVVPTTWSIGSNSYASKAWSGPAR